MSEDKIWKPTGRVSDAYGAWQAIAAAGGTAWTVLLGVSVWAFNTLQMIMEQGWGAVFLAGLGAASAAALALGVLFFGLAAFATGFRRIWPPSPPQAPAITSAPPPATDDLAREVAALRKDVDRALDAIKHNAKAMREEREEGLRKLREFVAHSLERFRKDQEAVGAQLRAVAEAAESRTRAVFDVLRDTYGPKFDNLGARQDGLEALLRAFERRVSDLLRARDAEAELRTLDGEASHLFDKLRGGEPSDYPNATMWHSDYLHWKLRIEKFWDLLRGYSESVERPFALADVDEDEGGHEAPEGGVFADPEVRRRYRILLRVNESHAKLRVNAFPFMADMGKPPPPNPA